MLPGEVNSGVAAIGAVNAEVDDRQGTLTADPDWCARHVVDDPHRTLDAWRYESPVVNWDGGAADSAVVDSSDLDDIGVIGDVVVGRVEVFHLGYVDGG